MQALGDSLAFWLSAFLAIVVVYLLPTLIAMILAFGPRRVPDLPSVPMYTAGR